MCSRCRAIVPLFLEPGRWTRAPSDSRARGRAGPGRRRRKSKLGGRTEQEALAVIDAQVYESPELGLPLDSFRDDGGADSVGEGLERTGHLLPDVARVDVLDELVVEFQVAGVHAGDLLQPRIAGADVVHRYPEDDLRELGEGVREHRIVLDHVFLSDLRDYALRFEIDHQQES